MNISVEERFPQGRFLSLFIHELVWHIRCQFLTQRRPARMETIAKSAGNKSSTESTIDWPVLALWLTYASTVFAILYAVIAEAF